MLTPQEVSSKTFPKAVMGGYAMVAVDEFLDKLTEDYTSLCKDNTALKAKIKLLAEKVEESRQTEESFRALLLSAQKMATEIVTAAERKRDTILQEVEKQRAALIGDAEAAGKARLAELEQLVAAEEKRLADKRQEVDAAIAGEEYRLERARTAVGKFMELSRSSCEEQLQILDKLAGMVGALPPSSPRPAEAKEDVKEEPEPPAPAAEEPPAAEPEEPAAAEEETAEELAPLDDQFFEEEPRRGGLMGLFRRRRDEEEDDEVDDEEEEPVSPARRASEEDDDADTRVISLDDLQFGRNYNKEK